MALAAARECPVRVASSGSEALRTLLDEPPSVLIAELDLPGVSGEQLAVRARTLPDPPLVVLIGADHERLSRAAGYADHTLRKPFEIVRFSAIVAEGCQRSVGLSR